MRNGKNPEFIKVTPIPTAVSLVLSSWCLISRADDGLHVSGSYLHHINIAKTVRATYKPNIQTHMCTGTRVQRKN